MALDLRSRRLIAWGGVEAFDLLELATAAKIPSLLVAVQDYNSEDIITQVISDLERAVCSLFPAWLPSADAIKIPSGIGSEAVAALARAEAAQTDLFSSYLIAISDAALHDSPEKLKGQFPIETVVRECYKLLCRAYGADEAAIIFDLGAGSEDILAIKIQEIALFIETQSSFRIWITGSQIERLDRVHQVGPSVSNPISTKVVSNKQRTHISPVSGKPNPLSETETRLEAFLCRFEWAAGRAWNESWSDGLLSNPIRVDLIWRAELLIVELDGNDHLEPKKYARDRARDRMLQAAGFFVLRFTNDEVAADFARIASEIEQFLIRARGNAVNME